MLDSVNEVSASSELLDLYSSLYEKRYRIRPILSQNGSDQTAAKDLIRQHGFLKARDLVSAFLRSDYWTFNQKKHPLSSLMKDINVVNAELGLHKPREQSAGPDLLIYMRTYCRDTRCNKDFHMNMRVSEIEKLHGTRLCPECEVSNE